MAFGGAAPVVLTYLFRTLEKKEVAAILAGYAAWVRFSDVPKTGALTNLFAPLSALPFCLNPTCALTNLRFHMAEPHKLILTCDLTNTDYRDKAAYGRNSQPRQ